MLSVSDLSQSTSLVSRDSPSLVSRYSPSLVSRYSPSFIFVPPARPGGGVAVPGVT